MGIIGFPNALQHDTTKSSQWGQTLFEGPFKYYEIFSKCRRIQKHPVMVKKKDYSKTSYQFWSNCAAHLDVHMILILAHFCQSWLDTN